MLYDKVGEFTKSTAEYEALLKANPKDADLMSDLGYSYYSRGDWVNAEIYLAKATELDPNHKKAWNNLGLARAQQGKWDDSFRAFCQAVRPADAHCNLAFVLAAQGNAGEAKAQYVQALRLDPALRVAQVALMRLENPQPRGNTAEGKGSKFDTAEAAAKVPTIAELEARMKLESTVSPVIAPVSDAKSADTQ